MPNRTPRSPFDFEDRYDDEYDSFGRSRRRDYGGSGGYGSGRARYGGSGRASGFDLLTSEEQRDAVRLGVASRDDVEQYRARQPVDFRNDWPSLTGTRSGAGSPRTRRPAPTVDEIVAKAMKQEVTRARSKKAALDESSTYHKKTLKEFDEGEEGLALGQLQAQLAKDEKAAGERVGLLRGAFTDAEAGDPTEEAVAAQGRMSQSRDRLEGLRQKRERMEAMAKESEAMAREAREAYHRLNDDRLGLTNEGLARAAGPIDVERLKAGLVPVERPMVQFPKDEDYPDDWAGKRVRKVNEERAAAGRSDFIDPRTMRAYRKEDWRRRGDEVAVDEGAFARATAANEPVTGVRGDLGGALELGRLKATGVTHVGAQPIDRMIERYGGEEAVEDGRMVQSYRKAQERLAEIESALPGMTDRGRKSLEDERDVLNRVLAEKATLVKERGLWDQVRDPTAGEKVKAFAGNAAGAVSRVVWDIPEFLGRQVVRGRNLAREDGEKIDLDQNEFATWVKDVKSIAGEWGKDVPPEVRKKLEENFVVTDVGQGLGSSVGFIGTSLIPGAVIGRLGKLAGLGEKGLAIARTVIPTAAMGSIAEANSLRDEVVQANEVLSDQLRGKLRDGSISQEEFNAARDQMARQAAQAETIGAVIGTSEAFPVAKWLGKLQQVPVGNGFARKFMQTLVEKGPSARP